MEKIQEKICFFKVVVHLSNITQIPEEDILDFATIIVENAVQ